jgi:glycosyltransferase involved in cell wall biosynthesis
MTPSPHTKRILVVGMADSIHLARWLRQFEGKGYCFRLVSSSPHRRIHPVIKQMLKDGVSSGVDISISWISAKLSLPLWLLDRFTSDFFRGNLVKREILRFKPDLVHALELQNAGYATAVAYRALDKTKRPKLLITNYGSDVYWFRQFPSHMKRLRELAGFADAFSAECVRDTALAKDIGFSGIFMETMPNSGGIKIDEEAIVAEAKGPSARKTIVIKGYQNLWGQALYALRAIEELASELDGYRIELFSCNSKTVGAAKRLRKSTGLEIVTHKKHKLSHTEVLGIMRRSIAYIGLSKSDGISTSMIEAMSQGAIPIQSDTSCANEWITNDQDGFLVGFDDWRAVAKGLSQVLRDPQFVSKARAVNYQTIAKKYDATGLAEVAHGYYKKLLVD